MAPASPKRRSPMISTKGGQRLLRTSSHTTTPLPAARPSAFTTQRPPSCAHVSTRAECDVVEYREGSADWESRGAP